MVTQQARSIDIGDFRKIRLRVNSKGYWEVWWTDAARGYITRRESCRSQILAEAEAYLLAFCDNARQAAAAVTQPLVPTIEDLCAGWLNAVARQGKDKTGRGVLTAPRKLLGRHTVAQLAGGALHNYVYQRGGGISDSTIRRELTGLKTVLLWAVEEKLIKADDVPSFKKAVPPEGPPRLKFLDPAQEALLWDAAIAWGTKDHGHGYYQRSAYRVMLFIALGLETAARREAIMDLTWDRVDLHRGTIDYNKPGRRLTKKRRVTGLPISERLMPVLKEAWLRAPKDAAGRATGLVVGGALDIRRAFASFVASIGLPWVTAHVLRHTFASLRLIAGAPIWKVAKVMGDTVVTVDKTYGHLMPGALDDVVNLRPQLAPVSPGAAA